VSAPSARVPAGLWSDDAGVAGGPLVVLVHGSMDRSAGLLRLGRRLADRFAVLRYDRRGYGRSAAVGPPFDAVHQVTDLAGLLGDRGVGPGAPAALVFGHSYGGNVALGLADRYPDLVAAVAIYETPMPWLDWWPDDTAGAAAVGDLAPADAAERFMRRLVGDRKWERLPAATRAARSAEGPAMVGELADLRQRAPWVGSRVRAPVLALRGERARPHHRDAVAALPLMLPTCCVDVVPSAGHVGPNTHPDAVVERLVSFLERVAAPAG